jgi:hypothetical protein
MKKLIYACLFSLMSTSLYAQDEGFIYGKITLIDGEKYEGPIRWGKEEIFWSDHFNASKIENENLRFLSSEELDLLDKLKSESWATGNDSWNWVNRSFTYNSNWNYDEKHAHQFNCEFGEIATIIPHGSEKAELVMRNGDRIKVDGNGYNDIGTKVKINDPELGQIDLQWDRVEQVEFKETPKRLDQKFGSALFGTVESSIGKFTGFIQWDHDERISSDKLDGDGNDGKISIEFGKIQSIERVGSSRSLVTLQSGRKIEMSGSNDVNSENRGVIVNIEGVGRVDIPWREFNIVTFTDVKDSGLSYLKYSKQNELTGSLTTRNEEKLKGKIVFDLDEAFDYEILHGELDNVKFFIPFKYIAGVKPVNYDYSEITLKNGTNYLLGVSQDVSDKNSGVLVFNSKNPNYIPWEMVKEIRFE